MGFRDWINSSDAEKFVDDQNPFEMSKAAWKASRIEALKEVEELVRFGSDAIMHFVAEELEKLEN
jgi:hypothetical protein